MHTTMWGLEQAVLFPLLSHITPMEQDIYLFTSCFHELRFHILMSVLLTCFVNVCLYMRFLPTHALYDELIIISKSSFAVTKVEMT